ncbi:MAG: preprotein translocase subunit SecA [Gammaproteobacteria bacterium]|nr:preprotein translocase subunit SecA [Gammaproteobacteria bacterium]
MPFIKHKTDNKVKGFLQKKLYKRALLIKELEKNYLSYNDDDFLNATEKFRERLSNGETLDDLLNEAYAVACAAAKIYTGMDPFPVQIMGAIVIHGGNIAEMKTGEGKTLTAVLPAYLNALTGLGVHIITVNDYLAGREANGIIGDLFRKLGLTVGLNAREKDPQAKREAYNSDIMYTTNNEIGFDYLRDNMVVRKEDLVMAYKDEAGVIRQRELNYAIIDEVDSVLIDEARTPLIISGGAKNTARLYEQADEFARYLNEDDYILDIKSKSISLSDKGNEKAERHFGIDNLYDIQNVTLLHNIQNALRANFIMQKDVDYVVRDDQVIIVDPFTGRLMIGRQFTEGLHQALEAKERVEVKKETTTLATITFQNFFRMYKKLSGMTGTAKTEEEEFINIYNMKVVEIPTNAPVRRIDANDKIFVSKDAKFKALVEDIKERHAKGQPILIGTIAIETSELVSSMLRRAGIKHNVLNAKEHEREAEIILNAGQKGAVTIATNMAGRGTDIKLGEGVVELGGLAVLGTERHESRRIDNQLRGRSGRQGDPGYSCFYMSAEDDLMARFGSERFKMLIGRVLEAQGGTTNDSLDFSIFSSSILRAQKQIEGDNFDQRKTVLQYDEVMRKQREVIYAQRRDVLFHESIEDTIFQIIDQTLTYYVDQQIMPNRQINKEMLYKELNGKVFPMNYIDESDLDGSVEEVDEVLKKRYHECIDEKKAQVPEEIFQEFYKAVMLRVVDTYWMRHIDTMQDLRQAVSLQSYAQQNPLREYQIQGFNLFNEMSLNIKKDTTSFILRAQVRQNSERKEVAKATGTNRSDQGDRPKRNPALEKKPKLPGRNDPCPCGAKWPDGTPKKYKDCHGK